VRGRERDVAMGRKRGECRGYYAEEKTVYACEFCVPRKRESREKEED